MPYDYSFSKDNLNYYLRALGKEFRKLNGRKMRAELILIGGASVIANYGFRENTYDIDAIILASSVMKDAINHVGDDYGLPSGWLNADFTKSDSYSPKLVQYSEYYKTFYGILDVRTVAAEYLVAMKLVAGREYKNDLSDIIGILYEHKKDGKPLTREMINQAVMDLYGDWSKVPEISMSLFDNVIASDDIESLYEKCRENEIASKKILDDFHAQMPAGAKPVSAKEILNMARAMEDKV